MDSKKNTLLYKDYIDKNIISNKKSYNISAPLHYAGIMAKAIAPLWFFLGNIESEFYLPKLEKLKIDKPVYVSGLARSGTTITLELLHESDCFSSFTYQFYPYVSFPMIWNMLTNKSIGGETVQRAHLDRIKVSAKSPEAIEEMIWMHFFPGQTSDPSIPIFMDAQTSNPAFEKFYRNSIKKIMLLGKKDRYLAKGNYNLARIPYILKINPDAKFILLIREPEAHIASLMKQHYLFCKVANPRVISYMKNIGHYEFGPHRVPPNYGSYDDAKKIMEAWESGDEILGWSLLWRNTYDFLYRKIMADKNYESSVHLIRYEELCKTPAEHASMIAEFCGIPLSDSMKSFAETISAPDYYDSGFSEEEKQRIRDITEETRSLFYG